MGTLIQDIKTQSDWIVKAFAADKLNLDYTVHSFIEIDKFFNKHTRNGIPVKGGRLAKNRGPILFSIAAYVGQTFIKNVSGSIWQTDDNDPEGEINASVKFPDDTIIFPMQRIMKRFSNGIEDSVYIYGYHITKELIDEPFDSSCWESVSKGNAATEKKWWKFW